jgi:Na+-driven multidrug efflux pump
LIFIGFCSFAASAGPAHPAAARANSMANSVNFIFFLIYTYLNNNLDTSKFYRIIDLNATLFVLFRISNSSAISEMCKIGVLQMGKMQLLKAN